MHISQGSLTDISVKAFGRKENKQSFAMNYDNNILSWVYMYVKAYTVTEKNEHHTRKNCYNQQKSATEFV